MCFSQALRCIFTIHRYTYVAFVAVLEILEELNKSFNKSKKEKTIKSFSKESKKFPLQAELFFACLTASEGLQTEVCDFDASRPISSQQPEGAPQEH